MDAATRGELVCALTQLARAIGTPQAAGLLRAASQAQRIFVHAADDDEPAAHRLALAIINAATATAEVQAIVETASAPTPLVESAQSPADTADEPPEQGLRPTTRQAIQVTVAASLAIVVGQSVPPSRWFWAVIATFVIFAGTNSWGETLTKGWQRLLGTMLGVPAGVLVATLFAGDKTAALVAVFVCLFCVFCFMTVTYGLMTFWITTILALPYGPLGEFSFGVLLLRIEETAIVAVIGVAVAILVLPTNTRTTIRDDTRAFLTSRSALIEISTGTMFGGEDTASPTEQACELDRHLQQFRASAKPLLAGVAGLPSRRSIRRELRLLSACDRYGRSLARSAEQYRGPVGSGPLARAFTSAAAQTRRNIEGLVAIIDGTAGVRINSTTDELDAAETAARHRDGEGEPSADTGRFLTAVHSLRQIERSVVTGASNLGARNGRRARSGCGLSTTDELSADHRYGVVVDVGDVGITGVGPRRTNGHRIGPTYGIFITDVDGLDDGVGGGVDHGHTGGPVSHVDVAGVAAFGADGNPAWVGVRGDPGDDRVGGGVDHRN